MFSRRTEFDLRPNDLTLLRQRRLDAGMEVLDLTVSNPTRAGLRYPGAEFLRAMSQEAALDYDPTPYGLPETRSAVASIYGRRGIAVDQRDIFLTSSTSEAYSFLFKLLADPGDRILLPRPSYPLFQYLCGLDCAVGVSYPLVYSNGWFCDLVELSRMVQLHRPKAILLVHPNNPTGSFIKAREWEVINSIAAEANTALICDEVFIDYRFSCGEVPDPAKPGTALTFVLNGLSKLLALPQVKLGWILLAGPDRLKDAARPRLELVADTYLSVSAMVQHAFPLLVQSRTECLRAVQERLTTNLSFLTARTQNSIVESWEVEGGWYAVVRLPATLSDEGWATEFLAHGVFVHPGSFFSFDRPGFVVVSLLTPPEKFARGLELLVQVANQKA